MATHACLPWGLPPDMASPSLARAGLGPARGTVQFGAARAMEMAARISGRRTLRAPTPSPLVREGTRSGDELWRRCRELTAVSDKGLRALRSVNVEK